MLQHARQRLALARLRRRSGDRVVVGAEVEVGRRVVVRVAPGARLTLGRGARLRDGARLVVLGGELAVGSGAEVGERCLIVATKRVDLGAGCVLGAMALVADADPRFADVERPVRLQGLRSASVRVGQDARVGVHAAVLAGADVGRGAHVGAYAVVRGEVPARAVVAGVPARVAPPTS